MSKGEKKIKSYLRKNKIKYVTQKKWKGCRLLRPLPFDFYLPKRKILIEYHGIQHYKPVAYFGGQRAFKLQKKRDKVKRAYANRRGIKLITISYKSYKNIEKILKRRL